MIGAMSQSQFSQGQQRRIIWNQQLNLYLFWDSSCGQYYYYDQQHDQLVYPDRRRIPRPVHVPRTFLLNPLGQTQSASSGALPEFAYSSSPPRAGYSYTSSPPLPALRNEQDNTYRAQPVTPRVYNNQQGLRTVYAKDDQTQVTTLFATGPKSQISDRGLLKQGVPAHRMLIGTSGESETLFPGFSVKRPGSKFFVTGRVFLVLWVEPAGENGTVITSYEGAKQDPGISTGRYNERIFSKVRRFVVIRENDTFCSALPIMSYGHRGVGKSGVRKSDHAIIYTENLAPVRLPEEKPKQGEAGMRSDPIRVTPDDKARDKLDPVSRIDFAKVHTIQHNIKVKAFGMVHPHSMRDLETQFSQVWGVQSSRSSRGADNDDDEARPSPTPSYNTGPTSAQTRGAYQRMLDQKLTPEQAMTALVAQLRTLAPHMSQAAAIEHIRMLLSQDRATHTEYGRTPERVHAREIPRPPNVPVPPVNNPRPPQSHSSHFRRSDRANSDEDVADTRTGHGYHSGSDVHSGSESGDELYE